MAGSEHKLAAGPLPVMLAPKYSNSQDQAAAMMLQVSHVRSAAMMLQVSCAYVHESHKS